MSDDKLVVKSVRWPGVDMSILDLIMTSSVPINWTIVTKAPYLKGTTAFIALRDPVSSAEVIKVNSLYFRIRKEEYNNQGLRLYRIANLDGTLVQQSDLNTISVKDKVRISSRKSFEKLFKEVIK